MSDRNLMIGEVEIVRVVDAIIDYPFPLEEFYPGVPVEAWDPWRKQYPTTFPTEKTHQLVYTWLSNCSLQTVPWLQGFRRSTRLGIHLAT